MRQRIAGIEPRTIGWFALLLVLQQWASVLRWQLVLRQLNIRVRFRTVARALLLERFVNQAVPGLVGGDAGRALVLARAGVPWPPLLQSILIDRVQGLVAIALVTLPALPFLVHRLSTALMAPIALVVVATAGGCAMLSLPAHWLRRLPRPLARPLLAGHETILVLAATPGWSLIGLALGIAVHLIAVPMVLLLAAGLGIALDGVEALAIVPSIVLLNMVPITFGGWGVREGTMIALLSAADVEASAALSISVLYGLGHVAIGLVGGAAWLLSRPRHVMQSGRSNAAN